MDYYYMGNCTTIYRCFQPLCCVFPEEESEPHEMASPPIPATKEQPLFYDDRVLHRNAHIDIDDDYLRKVISARQGPNKLSVLE